MNARDDFLARHGRPPEGRTVTRTHATLPERIPVMFPNDAPREVALNVVTTLRRQIQFLTDLADELEKLAGGPPPVKPPPPPLPFGVSAGAGERRLPKRKEPV